MTSQEIHVEIANHIYDNIFRAFGGSSQFGCQTMFDALQGHIRNGRLNPTSVNHTKVITKAVWSELLQLHFNTREVEIDDEVKVIIDKWVRDGFEIIEVNNSLQ